MRKELPALAILFASSLFGCTPDDGAIDVISAALSASNPADRGPARGTMATEPAGLVINYFSVPEPIATHTFNPYR